ncbi:AraC family transcriptional regulator [Caenispirillum bisanense]|uniref:AraC family transcriptional regulator n=1 Tax=Caenispirillum bisanense TaxID=414052 RepID=UPI0031D1EE61
MQILTVPALSVVRQRHHLTLPQVGLTGLDACPAVSAAAAAAGLQPAGPWIFAAHGMPRDAHTAFDLDYCLPVAGGEDCLPAFHCASAIYEGPLTGLFPQGYAPLLAAVAAAGLATTGDTREVYHIWDGPEAATNRVEIQIGLADGAGAGA